MARVTVEDCVLKVPNRFELVLVAAQRARAIASGASLTIDRDNDKNPVVALREIADETVDAEILRLAVVSGMQKHVEVDEPEEDNMALLMQSSEWAGVQMAAESDDDQPEGMSVIDTEEATPAEGEEA